MHPTFWEVTDYYNCVTVNNDMELSTYTYITDFVATQ